MSPKASWITLTSTQQRELESIVGPPGWRVVPSGQLPSAFPRRFREKIDSAVIVAEQTSTGGLYLGFNARRVDQKSKAIDMEPLAIIIHSTGAGAEGVFVHHGNWDERTQHPSEEFWAELSSSGIGGYYLAKPPSGISAGALNELPNGDRAAFDAAIAAVRNREDSKK